LMKPIIANMRK